MSLIAAVRAALLPAGLNLVAALPVERYDRDVPERYRLRKRYPTSQSLIVIGNGGGPFWEGFRQHRDGRDAQPQTQEPNPLDCYAATIIERDVPPVLASMGTAGRFLYPFRFDEEPVSFIHLGALAGFGARSLLGVLVHPEYGPWIALRAALLLDVAIESTPVTPFDPCGTCADKPCISACPGAAISERGWDVPACTAYRAGLPVHRRERQGEPRNAPALHSNPHPGGEGAEVPGNCADRCHARWECIYGRAHRYPADALAYHQRRALDVMRASDAA
ncbi:MAG: hypothetical protein HYR72_20390 [Deltaproteobacteria bacterium]|nr:hypothetical protein [Deltaproteobacteria bacterium]MBI3389387.1 hypothetical protein [Deltaproteobacteria bacterium]